MLVHGMDGRRLLLLDYYQVYINRKVGGRRVPRESKNQMSGLMRDGMAKSSSWH